MSRADETYPATCGQCMGALDGEAIVQGFKRRQKVSCPHCGRVLHRAGTLKQAVAKMLAERIPAES